MNCQIQKIGRFFPGVRTMGDHYRICFIFFKNLVDADSQLLPDRHLNILAVDGSIFDNRENSEQLNAFYTFCFQRMVI